MDDNTAASAAARETIARVDERTKAIQDELKQFRIDINNALISLTDRVKESEARFHSRAAELDAEHDAIYEKLDKSYVKRTEFSPVQRIVYGAMAIIATSVIGAILALVLKH